MIGDSLINSQVLNGIGDNPPITPLNAGEVALDGTNLITFGIGVNERDVDNPAKRVVKTENVPRGNGLTIIDDYLEEKTLVFEGRLRSSTAEEMATKMDQLKKLLIKQNAVLDYNIRGVTRRHIVNCSNFGRIFEQEKHWHLTVRPVTLQFDVLSSFGSDTNYTYKGLLAETANSVNVQMSNSGTYKAPLAVILVYQSAADVDSIKLVNTANGKTIKVNTSLTAGDVLEIDQEAKAVLKNGSEVDFDGFFIDSEVGVNTYTLTHEGATTPSVEFDATFKFKQTYL